MTDQFPVPGAPLTPPLPPPLPRPSTAPPARRRRHRVLAVILSSLGALLAVVVLAGFVIHLPKVIISPGSATPLDSGVVQISGAQTYPDPSGDVRFLTVQVSTSDPTVWRVVGAWLDPDRDVADKAAVQGCLSDADNRLYNTDLMDQSQQDAKYVALTRVGYVVPARPVQIRVVEVCDGTPAHGKLQLGDQVLAVDGNNVSAVAEVGDLVRAHRPGDHVDVTFDREGATRTTSITAGKVRTEGSGPVARQSCVGAGGSTTGTACLGVASQTFTTYDFPVDIKIDTQLVGGPSAGLAFTLAIIDDLTPGSLTGGRRVAVTGEIRPDGSVGEVGGVEQKAITARTNGVELMIVPKGEVADARRGAGDVHVVGVDSVDEALDALHRAGGAPVPPPSTTAARS